ncbi:acetyl esterase [Enterobacteriaceae bacterium RIT691]|nr:acetyl esterase [Enterobacteriaceae bacterium RIT691]
MKPENKAHVLKKISAQMQAVLDFQAARPQPTPVGSDFPSQRLAYNEERRFWNEGGSRMFRSEDVNIETRWGEVRTRIYAPQASTPATLFYLHGGGFVLGNIDTHDRIMRLLADYSGCTVIGIDYTLSPEAKFPQAIEESVDVCTFYHHHAAKFALNMHAIGFAGDSAGAMLALATALWLRDKKQDCGEVKGLLLWYGLYGLRDSASRRLYGGQWDGLTEADLASYESAYLSHPQDRESPYYCLFNTTLSDAVPPCFIAAAEYDPLIDDSLALCHTLLEHGQPCRYEMYPGTLHAFLHYSRMLPVADDALRDGARYFRQQLNIF